MRITVLGLSLSSSWGNGHATTWRALLRGMARRGHTILFLERERPWYAAHRDLRAPDWCALAFYDDIEDLAGRFAPAIKGADAVVVGSYVPDGDAVAFLVQELARGVTAFYDIDTPVTLDGLEHGTCAYLTPGLVPGFDLYLSFTGGPTLRTLEQRFGARRARVLWCSVDPLAHPAGPCTGELALGYLGTYSADRQEALDRLLLEPARRLPELRFAVVGSQYPPGIVWPANVRRIEHLSSAGHGGFYASQLLTLNLTRAPMRRLGHSPSVRLFEAAACGAAIVSDRWPGLDDILAIGSEVLVADDADDITRLLAETPPERLARIGAAARRRVLAGHTGDVRAAELERHLREAERPLRAVPRTRPAAASGRAA
jgi:spore maturation protein CgeB